MRPLGTEDAVDAWLWFQNGKGPLGLDREFWSGRRAQGWQAVWREYLERALLDQQERGLLLPLVALGRLAKALTALEALEKKRNPGQRMTKCSSRSTVPSGDRTSTLQSPARSELTVLLLYVRYPLF